MRRKITVRHDIPYSSACWAVYQWSCSDLKGAVIRLTRVIRDQAQHRVARVPQIVVSMNTGGFAESLMNPHCGGALLWDDAALGEP